MKIKVAQTAGFCFGVDRAVKTVYGCLEENLKICTYGPIIHNPEVIEDLTAKGVRIIDDVDQASEDETVIIRAHGATKEIFEFLKQKNISYIDATCPFVQKIHNIVKNCPTDHIVLIAGDENHPEVIGIRSEAKGMSFVFKNADELSKLIENENLGLKKAILVFQTTFSVDEANKVKKITLDCLQYCKIYGTICNATLRRQNEAEWLAQSCDCMIVIGGRFSSNTVKLKDLCSKFAPTFLVENVEELKQIDFSAFNSIGLTAGASTPANSIKGGVRFMADLDKKINDEDVVFSDEVISNYEPNDERVRKAYVSTVTAREILLDIPGGRLSAVLPAEEYSYDKNANFLDEVHVGDEMTVYIMKTNDSEGFYTVSKRLADAEIAQERIAQAFENDETLTAKVSEIRQRGVIVVPFGGRVFIPFSHCDLPRGASLESLKGKEVEFKIISVDGDRKRAVGSIRVIAERARAEREAAFWAEAEVGKEYHGKVTSVLNYGAFVDLGGVEALLHRTRISWKHIDDARDVLSKGDEVDVKIIEIKETEDGKKRISLSSRKDEDRPWPTFVRSCNIGDVVNVEIIEFFTFGAMARLVDYNVKGLIHIRDVANHFVEDIRNELKIGQRIDAQITDIDLDKHKIRLSIRALIEEEEEEEDEAAIAFINEQEEAEKAAADAEAAKEAEDVAAALERVSSSDESAFGDQLAGILDDAEGGKE